MTTRREFLKAASLSPLFGVAAGVTTEAAVPALKTITYPESVIRDYPKEIIPTWDYRKDIAQITENISPGPLKEKLMSLLDFDWFRVGLDFIHDYSLRHFPGYKSKDFEVSAAYIENFQQHAAIVNDIVSHYTESQLCWHYNISRPVNSSKPSLTNWPDFTSHTHTSDYHNLKYGLYSPTLWDRIVDQIVEAQREVFNRVCRWFNTPRFERDTSRFVRSQNAYVNKPASTYYHYCRCNTGCDFIIGFSCVEDIHLPCPDESL
jgi:hypothetical protein